MSVSSFTNSDVTGRAGGCTREPDPGQYEEKLDFPLRANDENEPLIVSMNF
jgi:hypothetical protein